jgi:hypothetical protein
MDYREQAFRTKFANSAKHLGVSQEEVISLKIRETVSSYGEYQSLIAALEIEAGLQCSKVPDDLQGHGYLLTDGKTKAIIVEHETGLEILYIAGSIASLIGLIPVVLSFWSGLRGRAGQSHHHGGQGVEIRRIDRTGHLVEDMAHGLLPTPAMTHLSLVSSALASAAEVLDADMKDLRAQVKTLTARVEAMERGAPPSGRQPKAKTSKTGAAHAKQSRRHKNNATE